MKDKNQTTQEPQECCPEVDPKQWDNKNHEWKEKKFITGSMPLIFHIPMQGKIKKLITGLFGAAMENKAIEDIKNCILLARDSSPWRGHYYLSVDNEVPGQNNVTISGNFISKVFDGPYSGVPKYMKQMNKELAERGKEAKDYYFYYTYCPKCAKKYGHNYIVAFAEI